MQPFNKYYPPDWTPDKGSANKFVGKHPLGDRARKIDKGILIVRFELPFNIWCEGCDNHIGMSVRYNAEKKKIGNYYSTPIWQFRMKCHLCNNWIEIHTNPKDAQYTVVSGARQKVEDWEPEDSEVIRLKDEALMEKMENDAFFKLEHGVHDENKAKESVPVLTQLQRLNDAQWSDPYTQSQQLRRKFRDQKRIDKANLEKKEQLRDKMSLHIDLVDEHPDDHVKAKLTEFADPVITGAEKRKAQVQVGPLFSKRTLSASSGSAKEDLATRLVTQTRKKVDPFLQGSTSFPRPSTNVTGNINGLANVVLKTSSTAANDKRSAAGSGSSLKSLVSSHYVDSDDSDA